MSGGDLGLNGLYDLPALMDGLGSSHEHLRGDYESLLSNAFGIDKNKWATASPARFNPAAVAKRVREGKAPQLILLDQSMDDQLVPFNQLEMFEADLRKSEGLSVIRGDRCSGKHAAPWEQGVMVWESVQDTLMHLREKPLYLSLTSPSSALLEMTELKFIDPGTSTSS